MDAGALASVGAIVVGAIVWLIRLEGRVNTQAVLLTELKEDIQYIRERIDRALNGK